MISLVVSIAAVVGVGTLVGVEIAVAAFLTPITLRLPVDASLAARADAARTLGRVMPFWYGGGTALVVLWIVLTWGSAAVPFAVASALLLACAIAMSALVLVPLNTRAASWTPENAPTDWRTQANRWNTLHLFRILIIAAALTLATLALAVA